MKHSLLAILTVGLLAAPLVSNAATLVVDPDGVLTGAQGVNVLGASYDVNFEVGLCSTFYGDCGPGGEYGGMYDPEKAQFAFDASYALLDQVLIGVYDTDAGLTAGCDRIVGVTYGRCYFLTPYYWDSSGSDILNSGPGMVYAVAVNGSVLPDDIWDPRVYSNDDMVLSSNNLGNWHPNPLTDGAFDPSSGWSVWAVWSPASATSEVPLPAAAWLLASGLLGLIGVGRKHRRS